MAFIRNRQLFHAKSASAGEAKLNFSIRCGMVSAVNHSISLDEQCGGGIAGERKQLDPCTIVIFGASGDLTARKLIPALYHLFKDKQMPPAFRVVGFARPDKTDDSWRGELRTALDQFSRTKPVDDAVWREFSKNIFYCEGDITDAAAYKKLEQTLASFGNPQLRQNLLFYLATQPSQFGDIVKHIHEAG